MCRGYNSINITSFWAHLVGNFCIKRRSPERQKFAEKTMHLKSAELDIVLVNNKTGAYA